MMGNVFQRADTYYFRVRINGQWVKRSAHTDNEDVARHAMHEAEKRLAMGLPLDATPQGRGQMLKDFVKEYLRHRDAHDADTERPRQALAHVLAHFPNIRLDALTPEGVDGYVAARRQDKRKPSPDTIQREIVVFKAMLNKATKWKRIPENPAAGAAVKGSGKARERQYTLDEIRRLIRTARELHPEMADLIEVAVQTACRLGELLRLRERDCDFGEDEITIWETKTDEPRRVPLHNRAWEILRKRCTDTDPERRVFSVRNTNRPFRQIARAAGVRDARFHDLRGSAASFLFETGADLPSVKAITGHKRADTLLKYYARAQRKTTLKAVRRLPTFRDGGTHLGHGKAKSANPARRKRLPVK